MKKRRGFVSNSSSSSFIVINSGNGYEKVNWSGDIIIDRDFGETDFGWGPEKISSFGSRIIFSYIQARDTNNKEWMRMIKRVVEEHTGASRIVFDEDSLENAYIDHQSHAGAGENIEMFESEEKLKDFLFGADSYIQLDNDNGSW